MPSKRILRVLLLVAAAVALAAAVATLQDKRQLATATVDEIEAQLGALDPGTRAAVIARLAKDVTDKVRKRD